MLHPLNNNVKIKLHSLDEEKTTASGIIIPDSKKRDEFSMVWEGTLMGIGSDVPVEWEDMIGAKLYFDKRAAKGIPDSTRDNNDYVFIDYKNVYAVVTDTE